MKKRLIILFSLILLCAAAVGFWFFHNGPSLVFVGYAAGKRVAQFELRNTTKRSIYTLNKYPIPRSETYLEKPIYIDASGTHAGDEFYLPGQRGLLKDPNPCQILPGKVFRFQIPLTPHNNPEQIGIRYYTGEFKDRWDFYNKLKNMKPAAPPNTSLKQRAKNYWDDFQRWLKRPRQHDAWSSEILQN